jgi:two-component system, chemotaxis family, CheB/CheR fusion protein
VHDATAELRESEAQLRMLASDLVRAEHEERRRIADMLHDDVQQLLFGAQMRLELLREDVAEGRLATSAHVDETDRYIAESIDKTRHLTVELAPPSLDDDDLAETIRSLVGQMRDLHGLDVDLTIESPLQVTNAPSASSCTRRSASCCSTWSSTRTCDTPRVDVTIVDGELDLHVSDGGKWVRHRQDLRRYDAPRWALGLATCVSG